MKQQQSKLNSYREKLTAVYENAKRNSSEVRLDNRELDKIFALPSPTKEQAFVGYVMGLIGCNKRHTLAA